MNQDNTGCLSIALVVVFAIGNLLLISGGLADDLSDNGLAWFMVIVAVILDLLGILMPDNMQFITNVKKQCKERTENKNYFCEITSSK